MIIKKKEFNDVKRYETMLAGRPLVFETGKLCELCNASVLTKYGEDTMYTDYPTFVTTGLLMYVGGEDTMWNAELIKAVGLLKDGEHTAVIQADDMFYIIQLVGSEPTGERSLTDAHDDVKAAVIAKNGETIWNSQMETWQNDTKLVTYFDDVYRTIGKVGK